MGLHKNYLKVGQNASNHIFGLPKMHRGSTPISMLISYGAKFNSSEYFSYITHKNISNMLLDWADDLRKSATKTRARVCTFDDFSRCFSAEKLTKTCPEVIHSEAFTSLLRLLLTEAKEISAGL